ncbi:hypothetical protein ACJIZ3_001618 [Penstemon smallii]|uniref:Uncharacterized protein n=1 Tax=Penstemon smallii TaxID=265156 RepID=A0ABD3U5G0_9LAMI
MPKLSFPLPLPSSQGKLASPRAYDSGRLDSDGSGSMKMNNRAFNKTFNKNILDSTDLNNNQKMLEEHIPSDNYIQNIINARRKCFKIQADATCKFPSF